MKSKKSTKKKETLSFFECKRRVVSAIDFRLDSLKRVKGRVAKQNDVPYNSDFDVRIDELESLRTYVKGMVVKA